MVRGARALRVRLAADSAVTVEHLLGYNVEHDVAALQLSEPVKSVLDTEDVELVKVGDRVVAIGSPLGLDSEGIISALRDRAGAHVIQTTVPISPGASGGPLLNEYGR